MTCNHASRFALISFVALLLMHDVRSESFATGITYLSFDSSPTSWVGRGMTGVFIQDDDRWRFTALRNVRNGVNIGAFDPSEEDPTNSDWGIFLSARGGAELVPGHYADIARYPFERPDHHGMTFVGHARGVNRNGGFFDVLEAVYAPDGGVLRFAVNFTQYEEEDPTKWIVGQFRYNSLVPEPSTATLLGTGVLGLVALAKRRFR